MNPLNNLQRDFNPDSEIIIYQARDGAVNRLNSPK